MKESVRKVLRRLDKRHFVGVPALGRGRARLRVRLAVVAVRFRPCRLGLAAGRVWSRVRLQEDRSLSGASPRPPPPPGSLTSLNPRPQCRRLRPDVFPSIPCWYCISSCSLSSCSSFPAGSRASERLGERRLAGGEGSPLRTWDVDLWSPMTRRPVCSFCRKHVTAESDFSGLGLLPQTHLPRAHQTEKLLLPFVTSQIHRSPLCGAVL